MQAVGKEESTVPRRVSPHVCVKTGCDTERLAAQLTPQLTLAAYFYIPKLEYKQPNLLRYSSTGYAKASSSSWDVTDNELMIAKTTAFYKVQFFNELCINKIIEFVGSKNSNYICIGWYVLE